MGTTSQSKRITLRQLRIWQQEQKPFAMLTCYDATTARLLEQAGVPTLLVGDSAAQVILGYDQSIFASMDFLVTITAAVRRGAPNVFLLGDMPFMSYQVSDSEAIRNAGRFMTEGMADAVKLEVDGSYSELVAKLTRAGVPVVAHLGWRPQRARYTGIQTAKVLGKTSKEVQTIVDEAVMMEQAGAVMLLLEQCTPVVAQQVVERVSVPVVGCGAGPACHGHVVVLQDLLGMTERSPSFVVKTGEVGEAITQAAQQWVQLIAQGKYMQDGGPYAKFQSGN